jgi:hypothetical protein
VAASACDGAPTHSIDRSEPPGKVECGLTDGGGSRLPPVDALHCLARRFKEWGGEADTRAYADL